MYLQEGRLKAAILEEGFYWFDTGTFNSQLDAANAIKSIETNRAKVICCPEKIGLDNGWLDVETFRERAELLMKNSYGQYLLKYLGECEEKQMKLTRRQK